MGTKMFTEMSEEERANLTNVSSLETFFERVHEVQENPVGYRVGYWSTDPCYMSLFFLVQAHDIDHVFECGTCAGVSATVMALGMDLNSKDGMVYTWDIVRRAPFKFEEGTYYQNMIKRFIQNYAEGVEVCSSQISGKKLFFIDGNHLTTPCMEDLRATLKCVKPGDVIALHDAHRSQVRNAIDIVLKEPETPPILKSYLISTKTGMYVIEV